MAKKSTTKKNQTANENIETTIPTDHANPLSILLLLPGEPEVCAELAELSVEKWRKHYPDAQILTVGGIVDDTLETLTFDHHTDPDVNTANILAAALADESVSEKFILAHINLFPVNDVKEPENLPLTCLARRLQTQRLTCVKNMTELVCTEQLTRQGWTDVYNYETGMPVIFEKEKLIEIFEKFNPQKFPTKIRSLYLNYHFKNTPPIPADFRNGNQCTKIMRVNPDMQIVDRAIRQSRFLYLSDDGWKAVEKLL